MIELAREWKRTAGIALLVAVVAGIRAGLNTPPWDTGDLLVGLYFAVLSLLFWLRAIRIRQALAREPSIRWRRAALLLGLGVGGLLVLADIATGGAL